MRVFINGEQLSQDFMKSTLGHKKKDFFSESMDWQENVYNGLSTWYGEDCTCSWGNQGKGFLNLSTSGTTGHPKQVSHTRDVIEQAVDANIKLFNLDKNSRIMSYYSPRGIAFYPVSLWIAAKLDCDLYIENFTGINYVDRIHEVRPTHSLILPIIWRTLHQHKRWKELDLSSLDSLMTAVEFTPHGMLDELRSHGAQKVYNAYGCTEVPPVTLLSEEENTYGIDNVTPGCDFRIVDDQISCKWSSQDDWWISGDMVEGDENRFVFKGRKHNMIKLGNCGTRIYPEVLEKEALKHGAETALCQEVNQKIILHYTGKLNKVEELKEKFSYIDRFRLKKVPHIEVDNNLRKVIRTQVL